MVFEYTVCDIPNVLYDKGHTSEKWLLIKSWHQPKRIVTKKKNAKFQKRIKISWRVNNLPSPPFSLLLTVLHPQAY